MNSISSRCLTAHPLFAHRLAARPQFSPRLAALPLLTAAVFANAILCSPAHAADDYPHGPITLVVPFAPGGNTDLTARLVADGLSAALKQNVVVENIGGAGGMVGAAHVAHAKPDGYTILLGNSSTNAATPAVNKNMPFDIVKAFFPIGLITVNPPATLTVSNRLNVSTFAQFKKLSQTQPKGVTMASGGVGSFSHLLIEIVRAENKLNAVHVPFKGTGPAVSNVVSGQVDSMIDQVTTVLPYIRDGKIRAIAQLGPKRSPLLPNVPTLSEQGFPEVDGLQYTGLFAPSGMPKNVQAKLVNALHETLADPKIHKRLIDIGADIPDQTQPQFAAFVASEAATWKKVVDQNHIVIDN